MEIYYRKMKLKVLIQGRTRRQFEISEEIYNNKRTWMIIGDTKYVPEGKLELMNFGRLDPEDLSTATDKEFIKYLKNKVIRGRSIISKEPRDFFFRGVQHLWKKNYWFSPWRQIF